MDASTFKRTDGRESSFSERQLAEFTRTFHGEPVKGGEERYDRARVVYNGMIDRHPALIASG
jgi:hypothetical protein